MASLDKINTLIRQDKLDNAINEASCYIKSGKPTGKTLAHALYLRGNAYQRKGLMRLALNDYLSAIDLDPDGPATTAYRMAQNVLNFYNHDLYNP